MRNYLHSGPTEKKSWDYNASQTHHDNFARQGKKAFISSNTSRKTLNISPERRYHIPCPVLDTLLQEMYHKLTQNRTQTIKRLVLWNMTYKKGQK